MGHSELLILATAIVVFAVFTLSLTEMQLSISRNNIENKIENYMIAEAQSFLEKLEIKKFDARLNDDNSIPTGLVFPDSLTPIDSLGIDIDGLYDDIDDYMGVFADERISINGIDYYTEYEIECKVYYVNNNLDSAGIISPTVKKKADVIIKSDHLNNDMIFSRVFSFY
ncbi:MAG: hypothetical protein JXQ65_04190 [Candidatus Marinimicrobia bacterium]|nr:hypothetical protein [Candidatus Neomarinimicrobiota bacterium]